MPDYSSSKTTLLLFCPFRESDTIIETSVLVESMKRFEKVDNEPRTQQIVKLAQSLDEDADGKINLDLVHDVRYDLLDQQS